MHCPAGLHVASFVLHGGNRHHGDQGALLQRPVGRQDFSVPFFTAAGPRLQESKKMSTVHTGEFGRPNRPDLKRGLE